MVVGSTRGEWFLVIGLRKAFLVPNFLMVSFGTVRLRGIGSIIYLIFTVREREHLVFMVVLLQREAIIDDCAIH